VTEVNATGVLAKVFASTIPERSMEGTLPKNFNQQTSALLEWDHGA
jgi:hypothetical protein